MTGRPCHRSRVNKHLKAQRQVSIVIIFGELHLALEKNEYDVSMTSYAPV